MLLFRGNVAEGAIDALSAQACAATTANVCQLRSVTDVGGLHEVLIMTLKVEVDCARYLTSL